MHKNLQIHHLRTIGADDDIGIDPLAAWDVAAGVRNFVVTGIKRDRPLRLPDRRSSQSVSKA
jgi:hypothetical protein